MAISTDAEALRWRGNTLTVLGRLGVDMSGRPDGLLMGLCPLHRDTRKSLALYPDGYLHCFGSCGFHGDILALVATYQRTGMQEALESIVRDIGFRLSDDVPPPPERIEVMRDRVVTTAAARFYAGVLWSPDGAIARRYLHGRGISLAWAMRLGLGYATGRGLWHRLLPKFGSGRLVASHLFNKGGYERFEGRLLFYHPSGWLVGRSLDEEAESPYMNLPGERPLLGSIDRDVLHVVEGPFDYAALSQWGYNVVALCGDVNIPKLAKSLAGTSLYLSCDADEAGDRLAEAIAEYMGGKRVLLPEGFSDPARLALVHDGGTRYEISLRS